MKNTKKISIRTRVSRNEFINPLGTVAKGKVREIIGSRNDALRIFKGKAKI